MSSEVGDGKADHVETLSAVVLALATVATAWSGYQASRWNGEQAKSFSRANATRIESTRASELANAQTQIDVATFTQWVDAYAQEQTELADFYYERFRAGVQAGDGRVGRHKAAQEPGGAPDALCHA